MTVGQRYLSEFSSASDGNRTNTKDQQVMLFLKLKYDFIINTNTVFKQKNEF